MPLPDNEKRLWIQGVPKSSQGKTSFQEYKARIQAVAREHFPVPVTTGVEVTILFKDRASRPDVDNVDKKIVDALQGIAFVDDNQVRHRTVALVDEVIATMVGDQHLTFQRLKSGDQFLIIVVVAPSIPSVTWQVRSS